MGGGARLNIVPAVGALRDLKDTNRVHLVDALRRGGTASRADLARTTGLSPATVSTLVAGLRDRGLVVEASAGVPKQGRTAGGRPPVLLSLDPRAGVAVGVALSHGRVRAAVADLSSRVLAERCIDMDVDRSAGAALDTAAALVDEVLAQAKVDRGRAIGASMALPGPVDRRTGRLGSTALMYGWTGVQPLAELERRLGMTVTVDNDARLGAVAEARFGAARGVEDLVYVLLSEGVGAGLVLGGRVLAGSRGYAGEIGHNQVDPAGKPCRCGKRGCLETFASVPHVLDRVVVKGSEPPTLQDVLASGAAGDPHVQAVMSDAGQALGQVLAALCNSVNPAAIVIGGQLAAAGDLLLDSVRDAMARHLSADAAAAPVSVGLLGDRAALIGALTDVIQDTDRLASAGLPAFTPFNDRGGRLP